MMSNGDYQKRSINILIVLLICLSFGTKVFAGMLPHTIMKGVIQKFDSERVWLKDDSGQTVVVPRKEIPQDIKLGQGKRVEYIKKVDIKNFIFDHKVKNRDKLTKQEKMDLVSSYQEFLLNLDENLSLDGTFDLPPLEMETTHFDSTQFDNLLDIIFDRAIAAKKTYDYSDSKDCFYGGWPSKVRNNHCQKPWRSGVDKHSEYTKCGPDGYFRCNPTIFGPMPKKKPRGVISGRKDKKGDEGKGMCVRSQKKSKTEKKKDNSAKLVDDTRGIVKQCLKASKLEDVIENIDTEKFKKFEKAVRDYCHMGSNELAGGKYGTDYDNPSKHRQNQTCLRLGERLADIGFALEKEKVCTVLNAKDPSEFMKGKGCKKEIKIKCSQGGRSWIGYLSKEDSQKASSYEKLLKEKGKKKGRIPRSIAKNLQLVEHCNSEDRTSRGSGCEIIRVAQLNSSFSDSKSCKSLNHPCMVKARCPKNFEGETFDKPGHKRTRNKLDHEKFKDSSFESKGEKVEVTAVCKCENLSELKIGNNFKGFKKDYSLLDQALTPKDVQRCLNDDSFETISELQSGKKERKAGAVKK